ncbi:MAG TPA: hypothetical protein VGP15_12370, partial [Burkholderiales bacterium]|nr:hypothetical protein [Burkholderiales bacterium]
MSARLAAVAAALALAACASPPEAPPEEQAAVVAVAPPTVEKKAPIVAPVPVPTAKPERVVVPTEPKTNEVDSLLAEFERLRRLPAAELPREQELARQAFNQSRSDAARVKLAMATAVPGSPPGEEARTL